MKRFYDFICFVLTFLMLLSLFTFVFDSTFKFTLPKLYCNFKDYLNPLFLILDIFIVSFIMGKYYKFSTHHLFYRN